MPQPFQLTLPGKGEINAYVHRLLNYRYHWHQWEYELCVLVRGAAVVSRGSEMLHLDQGGLLVTDPGCSHASFALEPDTQALVLRFTPEALPLTGENGPYPSLAQCACRGEDAPPLFSRLRQYAASLLLELDEEAPACQQALEAWMSLVGVELTRHFGTQEPLRLPDAADARRSRRVTEFLEEHYREKLTLDSLAEFTGYNRTYLSTLFKNSTGTNFHEYLTRIRFQHAVEDLTYTAKTLTEVALDNGFPELKLFNARFRSTFGQSPAEYRARLTPGGSIGPEPKRSFCPLDQGDTRAILERWAGR